jgi:hypothetical protein
VPRGTASSSKAGGGRVTPSPRQAGPNRRYTPPITKQQRHSPRWYPFVLIGLLVFGLLVIIANYSHLTPGGTKNWYLVLGIGSIMAGLVMSTYYR